MILDKRTCPAGAFIAFLAYNGQLGLRVLQGSISGIE